MNSKVPQVAVPARVSVGAEAANTIQPPKVSVLMVTYNQERFIAQAIESVLMQRTSFRHELVIGEDCSTDGTRLIVTDYARRHPERIHGILREKNLGCAGPERNLLHTLAACRGRYIAWLDGDDYWTAPDKLQKQADYLDAHPGCVQCFHAVRTFIDGEQDGGGAAERRSWIVRPARPYSHLTHHLLGNLMIPCSVMFRRGLFGKLPDWYFRLWMDDWPLFVLNAQHGRTGYIDDVMAAYRIHPGGWWQRLNAIQRQLHLLDAYDAMNDQFARRYDGVVRAGKAQCCFKLAMAYERAGDLEHARTNALKSLLLHPHQGRPSSAQLVRVLFRGWMPAAYDAARAGWKSMRNREVH